MLSYRLRHRITIQQPSEAQESATGEMIRTYSDLYANVPAEVLTGPGRVNVAAGAEQNSYDARINIRWFDITLRDLLDCRIIWDGRIYEIDAAEQDITARREWRLMCKGGVEVYQQ